MKSILFLFFIGLCFITKAQDSFKLIDKKTKVIEYNQLYGGKMKNAKLYYNDTATLYIYNKSGWDTGFQKGYLFDKNKGAIFMLSSEDSLGQIVFRNFKTNEIKLRQTSIASLEAFTVDDNWIKINWIIEDSFKLIDGFNCKKAIGAFRGRNYTAWFAFAIPQPYGPWKLFGLPGLILEAYDKEKVFYARAVKVGSTIDSIEIKEPTMVKNKTMEQYVFYKDHVGQLIYEHAKEIISKHKGMSIDDPKFEKIKSIRKKRYERKYEWEEVSKVKRQKSIIDISKD